LTGSEVTLFNRGVTNPELFPETEKLRGDRGSDLSALRGHSWDAVIDVACYEPSVAKRSVEMLRDHVGTYVFVSTLSVYADHSSTESQREDALVLEADECDDPASLYGARKASCEDVVLEAMGNRCSVARAGLIVGPHDPTDRFSYWPRRMALGGQVLAPGSPADPVQFIDVRDLASWLVSAASTGDSGIFNVTGLPMEFGDFLGECMQPSVDSELAWVASDRLISAGLDPWMGIPMWIAAPGWEAANKVDISRALASGLGFRPLSDTIEAALDHIPAHRPMPVSLALERDLLSNLR
jgi:2'-hydroxyisoflavone reductase